MNRSIKKVSTLLLVAGIITTSLFFSGEVKASENYKDIPKKHWAYSTIQEATKLGYFKGDGNGNFKPDNDVTRAEFAQILANIFDSSERTKEPFTDIKDNYWGKDAIEELLALGIINEMDYSNNRFEPTKAMTRSELAKWLTNALNVKQPEYEAIMKTIRDSQSTLLPTIEYLRGGISKAEQGYIGVMLGTELFTGYVDGSFKPQGKTSRSEVAALAIRFKNMQDKAPTSFKGLNELVEVAETGTNMKSATKLNYAQDGEFKKVANKNVELADKIGTYQMHRLIFVETSKTAKESMNNSIYAKMFFDEKDDFFAEETIYVYIEQSLKPKKQLDYFSLTGGLTSSIIVSTPLEKKNAKQYNLESINQSDIKNYFKVEQTKRYWTNTIIEKDWTIHFNGFSANKNYKENY